VVVPGGGANGRSGGSGRGGSKVEGGASGLGAGGGRRRALGDWSVKVLQRHCDQLKPSRPSIQPSWGETRQGVPWVFWTSIAERGRGRASREGQSGPAWWERPCSGRRTGGESRQEREGGGGEAEGSAGGRGSGESEVRGAKVTGWPSCLSMRPDWLRRAVGQNRARAASTPQRTTPLQLIWDTIIAVSWIRLRDDMQLILKPMPIFATPYPARLKPPVNAVLPSQTHGPAAP
jgi:hypothetical protein